MENIEIWKDIKGYEGLYQISNMGRVKSLKRKCKTIRGERTVNEKIRSLSFDTYGYLIVQLKKEGIGKTRTIHRLVAETFIENPNNYTQVNHIDEDKTNNCVSNLEWCTMQQNNSYGTRAERIRKSQQLAIIQCDLEGNEIREWEGMGIMSRETGYDQGLISRVCNGKRKTAYGYKWKFK